jgi:26S proteasome regulatory subunit N11
VLKEYNRLTGEYKKWIDEEIKKTKEEFIVSSVGKLNPKNHLMSSIEENLNTNVMECLGTMVNTVVF